MITLTAFRSVPPSVQGLVRDLRVRWALAEAGIPYQERLVGPEDLATSAYRALQPFGQIPAIDTDELNLFESGAIVLHIAEQSEALMPSDTNGRARTRAWMFAALNSVGPSWAAKIAAERGEDYEQWQRSAFEFAQALFAATERSDLIEGTQQRTTDNRPLP